MTTYSYNNSLEELIDAHSVGLTIELNGSAVNGGYGETWNKVENFDPTDLYDLDCYRVVYETASWRKAIDYMDIVNSELIGYPVQFNEFDFNNDNSPDWKDWDKSPLHEPYKYRIGYEKVKKKVEETQTNNTQKIEITLQFDIPEDFDYDQVNLLMRREFPNYEYRKHFVNAQIITDENQGMLYDKDRLEKLEQRVSLINEMFNGDENNMSEGLSLALGNHARYFRNKKGE